jgi:protoheme IX farnesyltransferase
MSVLQTKSSKHIQAMNPTSNTTMASPGWAEITGAVGRYVSLLKLRPMSVVIYSAVVGLIAARGNIDALTAIIAVVCIAAGGFGSAALNMWYEADIDAKMARTAGRVLPSGKVKATNALVFGGVLCLGATVVMGLVAGWFAATVLAATIFAYFGLYTVILKRRTALNVVIGGSLAGVLTPLCGWAAATGEIGAGAIAMFIYVAFWTPPHVWSQATYRMADYAKGGVPMLPVTAGIVVTQRWIFVFTAIHVAAATLPWFTGDAGLFYLAASSVAGLVLLAKAMAFLNCRERRDVVRGAREFFRISICYIVVLLTALAIDRMALFG